MRGIIHGLERTIAPMTFALYWLADPPPTDAVDGRIDDLLAAQDTDTAVWKNALPASPPASALTLDSKTLGVIAHIHLSGLKPKPAEEQFARLLAAMESLLQTHGGAVFSPDLERLVSMDSDHEALARSYIEALARDAQSTLKSAREGRAIGVVALMLVLATMIAGAQLLPSLSSGWRLLVALACAAVIVALLSRFRRRG